MAVLAFEAITLMPIIEEEPVTKPLDATRSLYRTNRGTTRGAESCFGHVAPAISWSTASSISRADMTGPPDDLQVNSPMMTR